MPENVGTAGAVILRRTERLRLCCETWEVLPVSEVCEECEWACRVVHRETGRCVRCVLAMRGEVAA
jgi:hypothetical protein